MSDARPPAILSLGTAVPPYCNDQMFIARWMVEALGNPPALGRWLNRLYQTSGIETRYTCLPDGERPPSESRFGPGRPLNETATTFERMKVYEREATAVATEAARQALDRYRDSSASTLADVAASVTHVIAVSCTGFFAPGLDLALTRRLGLRPEVQRTMVGFMGCAAAFNALRLADQIVRAQPSARVLVVCVELCSLHIQPGQDRINLLVASLFSDGAAACLVGRPPHDHGDIFEIQGLYTAVKPDTEEEMVWRIGDYGFVLHLSPQIPEHLGTVAPEALGQLFSPDERPGFWAVHPGGRGIVDRLGEIFDIGDDQLFPTREVLRRYGNMSSPTILFVLNEWQRRLSTEAVPRDGVAMAFGPGLVTEMARLRYIP